MQCPRCKISNFTQVSYEGISVDKCQVCQGIWLDGGEVEQIIKIHEKEFSQEIINQAIINSFSGVPKAEIKKNLKCPKCHAVMSAINYEVSSGVIVDRCDAGHGIWFDKHELENIQAYREYWTTEIKKHEESFVNLIEKSEEKKTKKSTNNSFLFTLAEVLSRLG